MKLVVFSTDARSLSRTHTTSNEPRINFQISKTDRRRLPDGGLVGGVTVNESHVNRSSFPKRLTVRSLLAAINPTLSCAGGRTELPSALPRHRFDQEIHYL